MHNDFHIEDGSFFNRFKYMYINPPTPQMTSTFRLSFGITTKDSEVILIHLSPTCNYFRKDFF